MVSFVINIITNQNNDSTIKRDSVLSFEL
jgi:hypothetical protein